LIHEQVAPRRGKTGLGFWPRPQQNRMRFQPRAWFSASGNLKRCSLRTIPGCLFSKQTKDTGRLEGAYSRVNRRVSVPTGRGSLQGGRRVQNKTGEMPTSAQGFSSKGILNCCQQAKARFQRRVGSKRALAMRLLKTLFADVRKIGPFRSQRSHGINLCGPPRR
jgi:hypothetical protein